jgi:hypothetical protein
VSLSVLPVLEARYFGRAICAERHNFTPAVILNSVLLAAGVSPYPEMVRLLQSTASSFFEDSHRIITWICP